MTISLVGYDAVTLAPKGCKRCGSKTVAWKSKKRSGESDTWWLVEVFDFDGELRAKYNDFHSGYCHKPELHDVAQQQINEALGIQSEEKISLSVEAEERKAAEESEYFLTLHDLCKATPEVARQLMISRVNAISRLKSESVVANGPRIARLQTEIDFMRAALGLVAE